MFCKQQHYNKGIKAYISNAYKEKRDRKQYSTNEGTLDFQLDIVVWLSLTLQLVIHLPNITVCNHKPGTRTFFQLLLNPLPVKPYFTSNYYSHSSKKL